MKEQGKDRKKIHTQGVWSASLGWEAIQVPCLKFRSPTLPAPQIHIWNQKSVPSKVFWIFCLFNKCDCVSTVCIDKVPTPSGCSLITKMTQGYEILSNAASQYAFKYSKGKSCWGNSLLKTFTLVCKAWYVPVVQFPLLFTKVKLWIKKKKAPSAYRCNNAWFYFHACQPLAWHFN